MITSVYQFNIKVKFIMPEAKQVSKRERFVSFGFEQSLRKYQPPVRKFFKPDHQKCSHCNQNDTDAMRQQRLSRLCETRKKYQITSRQQASEYSKKKDRLFDGSKVNRQSSVSDFDCSEGLSSQCTWQNPASINSNLEKQEVEGKTEWIFSRIGSVTPVKQQIRHNMKMEEEELCRQIQLEEQQQINKAKDIDFHIGLVEELHGELLKEYQKIQTVFSSIINLPSEQIKNPFSQKKGYSQVLRQEDNARPTQKNQYDQEQQENMSSEDTIMFIRDFQRFNINAEQIQSEEGEINENSENIEIHSQKEAKIKQVDKSRTNKLSREKKMLTLCQISVQNGRIRIEGDKGPCFLSKRNLLKLFSQASLNEVTEKVRNIHPYLNDPSQVLKSLLNPTSDQSQQNY